MANFNKVLLMGNLTRDPQLKYLPNQTPVVEFGLASNRRYRVGNEDREDTLFVDCSAFGRQAEVINEYCQKGKPIFIEGRLKYDQWEDKNGGGKRNKLTIVVENFQFLGGRGGDDDSGGGGGGGGYSRGGGDDYSGRSNRGGGGGGGGGGNSGGRNFDSGSRSSKPQKQNAPEPFDDEEQFAEDDIPF